MLKVRILCSPPYGELAQSVERVHNKKICLVYANVVEWYTRLTQNQVAERSCGFESHHWYHWDAHRAVGVKRLMLRR